MRKLTTIVPAFIAAATLALPLWAAAAPAKVACNVDINYTVNGTPVDTYLKDFEVTRGETFFDDLSTAIREKRFSASLARIDGKLMMSIDYNSDVSVFNQILVDTSLQIRGVDVVVSTGGTHMFSSSQAVPSGNHRTTHALICHRLADEVPTTP